jgi:hypothetical protein
VIRRYSALVDGALLKVRSDRPEMAQYCTNTLQAATSNCACARLWGRNVGTLAQRRGFREYLQGLLLPRDRNKALTALAGTEPIVGAQGAPGLPLFSVPGAMRV